MDDSVWIICNSLQVIVITSVVITIPHSICASCCHRLSGGDPTGVVAAGDDDAVVAAGDDDADAVDAASIVVG